jgi:hypothetical protein
MSYWGVLSIISMLAIIVQFGVVAGPAYLDDLTINKVIEERLRVAKNTDSYNELERSIEKQLELNGMQNVKVKELLTIAMDDGVKVNKKYEIRKPFISNIDLVIHFEKTFDQKAVQAGGSD